MPKFSVIIPVYNVEKYLRECLESLVNQTLKDIEFICVNDGSTDSSLDILNKYAKKDSRFVIINQHNQGQGVARNNALAAAKGEYVAFVDPDDWVETNMLEELYAKFKETNAEVIQFNFKMYFEEGGKYVCRNLAKEIESKYDVNFSISPCKNIQCLTDSGLAVWHRAYSLQFLRQNNIYFMNKKIGEDTLFSIKAKLLASKFYFLIDKYLYYYRVRIGSAVNSFSNDNFAVFHNLKEIENFLIEKEFLPKLKIVFNQYVFKELVACYRRIPHESIEEYENKCKEILTPDEFKKLKKAFKLEYGFWNQIFSVRNLYKHGVKYKIVTILGFKFEFK